MIERLEQYGDWQKHAETERYRAAGVARRLGFSPRTLRRKVKESGAAPLRKTLLALRLQRGLAMLAEGKHVNEAAEAAGYAHATNFSRALENCFGVRAAEARRRLQQLKATFN